MWTRRAWLRAAVIAPVGWPAIAGRSLSAQAGAASDYGSGTLPPGIRSRLIAGVNGIRMHALEAGDEGGRRPALLLLHGFPELAYSWRKVMLPLAEAGFHVIAPDQRGYGRSGATDVSYEDDLQTFSMLNHVTDALGLVRALGHHEIASVVGHDTDRPLLPGARSRVPTFSARWCC